MGGSFTPRSPAPKPNEVRIERLRKRANRGATAESPTPRYAVSLDKIEVFSNCRAVYAAHEGSPRFEQPF